MFRLKGNFVYLVKKPDNTTTTWSASVTEAATGVTEYTASATDIGSVGEYELQPKVTFIAPAKTYFGDKVKFTVDEIIQVT